MVSRLSYPFLKKTAIYGAAITCTAGFLIYYKIQARLASAPYYTEAVAALRRHPLACDALGPPLRFKALNLGSKENWVTEERAHILIPVAGTKSKGHVRTQSHFQDGKWNLDQAILEFKGKPIRVTLYSSANEHGSNDSSERDS